jgi:RNA polymerase sigma-70 factor (ECF subfamily)
VSKGSRVLSERTTQIEPQGYENSFGPVEASAHMSDLVQGLEWGRDESHLVSELRAGSESAFDWLVTYYHAPVYNLVYGMLSDPADAADVTQEVFLRAFRGIRGFRQGSSLKTWLYRISVREALNHRRWCWRHHRNQVSIETDPEGETPALQIEDEDATPFERLAATETQDAVRRALAAVPGTFRTAVILRDLEGLAYEEVAEVLEVSVGTVKSRILRGRRALRESLESILNPRRATETPLPADTSHYQLGSGFNVLSKPESIDSDHASFFTWRRGARGQMK